MTAPERLRDMARVLGDTEWGASLADELRDVADEAEREARRAENPNSKLRRRRMQAHVMEVQRICAERKRRIRELNMQLAESRADAERYARMLGICADGTPARRLDEVWTVDGDGPYHVDCNWADGTASLVEVTGHVECRTLTHERPEAVPEERPEAVPVDADGAPIRVGDTVWSATGVELTVTAINDSGCRPGDWIVTGTTGGNGVTSFYASEVSFHEPGGCDKRPAPKALDADGAEIEVGDDLYSVEGMLKFHVSAIDKKNGRIATEAMFALDKWADPKMYTHRAPVIAADGKQLREGEMVYHIESGDEFTVMGVDAESGDAHVRWGYDFEDKSGSIAAKLLTHERPDSWERFEEDAVKSTTEYWRCPVAGCDHCSAKVDGEKPWERFGTYGNCNDAKGLDLVRRAKALGERDR